MAEEPDKQADEGGPAEAPPPAPQPVDVAPAPHLLEGSLTTRRMMLDVLVALAPAALAALFLFGLAALRQLAVCAAGCIAAEALFMTLMRRKGVTVLDGSAAVTGVILAFSLPATTPWWVSLIGAFVAVGLGKAVFGGVGMNVFNPAMVGRAFVMIAFVKFIAADGYVDAAAKGMLSQATPMTDWFRRGLLPDGALMRLFLGNTNGSLGETSAILLILGGFYLCIRRTASWEIPAGAIAGLLVVGGLDNLVHPDAGWTVLHHLFGGAFLLGAFFIITDPATSPLTPVGKLIFGLVFGVLVMLIRLFTDYPEGVMFSVLLVNAIVPLLNRWTIPTPVGGPVPAPAKK